MPGVRGTPEFRFRSKYVKIPGGCWEWKTGSEDRYPVFWDGKRSVSAHRYALERKLGRRLKRNEMSLHTCDNKRCVRPSHLFAGVALDNSKDMIRKGRKERGESVVGSAAERLILTEADIIPIRDRYAAGETCKQIAKDFPCTPDNILAVVRGKSWKHIGGPIGTRKPGPKKGTPRGW